MNPVIFSRQSDEWSTPQYLFDALDVEFTFGLDAAATETNAKCTAFFTAEDDALTQDWCVLARPWSIFVNPPYSQCRAFVHKAAESAKYGAQVVMLLPARTDTRWFHDHIWDAEHACPRTRVEVRFLKGRLRFGEAQNSAPFPSMIVIFRPHV